MEREDSSELLNTAIKLAVENLDLESAQFLAERLVVSTPGLQSTYTLSKTYFLSGQVKRACFILDSTSNHVSSIILYATCCLKLGKYAEGELSARRYLNLYQPDVFNQSALYCLIGRLCSRVGRIEQAKEALIRAISLNPLNWSSHKLLSDIGHCVSEFPSSTTVLEQFRLYSQAINIKKECLSLNRESLSKKRSVRTEGDLNKRHGGESKIVKTNRVPLSIRSKQFIDNTSRKKVHLENGKNTIKKELIVADGLPKSNRSICDIIVVIQKIISAYSALKLYKMKIALGFIDLIPFKHQNTGFVMSIKSQAYFELSDYKLATVNFKALRQLEPLLVDSMDMYGTCLWHLKSFSQLSYLGKEMEELDCTAPQTWCVIGNYYSLINESEQSIKAFQRATHYDPHFTYAHTLLGHELLSNEELDLSKASFHSAIQTQPRHYNAMYVILKSYGLGLIEKKKERFKLAEYYFRQALEVNPDNPILIDSIASVIRKDEERFEEAMSLYIRLLTIAPDQKIYILHQAQLLFLKGEYEKVASILEQEIKTSKPESSVYFLLGKAYAKIGRHNDAILAMTFAQDYIEHKSSNVVKDEMVEDDDMTSFVDI